MTRRSLSCLTHACALLFLSSAFQVASAAIPASQRGLQWYRGNTHCHSLWSDGDEFPEMVANWYKTHGYDFLALSDHNVLMEDPARWRALADKKRPVHPEVVDACRARFGEDWVEIRGAGAAAQVRLKTLAEFRGRVEEPGSFLMIQGEEITGKFTGAEGAVTQVHVNAINLSECIPPQSGASATETIAADVRAVAEQARRSGRTILAHVNHPTWKYFDLPAEMLAGAREARLFEVCNFGTSEYLMGDGDHPGIERMWDIANTLRIARMQSPPLLGVASDDTHAYHTADPKKAIPGRAWIMVRAARFETDALVTAIERGDFYASTGVTLKDVTYDRDARTLRVSVDPEPGGRYTIEFVGTLADHDPGVREIPGTDKDGKPSGTILQYSDDVGEILARIEGTEATYRLTGKELYVRAVVRSDLPVPAPKVPNFSTKQAWCQPVGWETRVTTR